MKLSIAEPRLLADSISIISDLVNDVRFKIDKDKIELIAMDPANVAMVIFKLLSSAFSEYKVDKEIEIGVGLDALKSILKRAKPSDVVVLEIDTEKNRLKVQLKSDSVRTFNLALLDIEDKEQKIPDLSFPLKIDTNSAIFDDAIQDMDIVSESVALAVMHDKFIVEAESAVSDARTEIPKDNETSIKNSSKEEIRAKYSIEYLKKITKGGKLSNKVCLQFNKNYPLRVDYLVKDKLSLSFILAPRISND